MRWSPLKSLLFVLALQVIQLPLFGQTWVQKASLPASNGGFEPISFSIGGKLYVGGGYFNGNVLSAFYEYDPSTNAWTQKASLIANRYASACFVINGKGYMATGVNPGFTSEVYMYDPVTNTWTQKNNFPGTPRQISAGFSLNGKGYVFGGFIGGSSVTNDMWQYDPIADTWTQLASAPGPGRNAPTAQVINNQAYVGLGSNSSGSVSYSDFYIFDPVANTYTQVANIPVSRAACAHFAIGGYGYIGVGQAGTGSSYSMLDDFYKYDPGANTWTQLNNFGGSARAWVFSQTVGNLPYVGAGADLLSGVFNNDNWTWADSCTQGYNLGRDTTLCGGSITLSDTVTGATSLWSTGATTASINVNTTGNYWVQVTSGACVYRDTIHVTVLNAPPTFSLGNDTTYCGAFSRTLSTGNASTLWSTGVTAASISVSAPGVYWGQITGSCGSVRDSIIISQNPIPSVNLGDDTNLCAGNTLLLNATTAGASYTWQDGTSTPTFQVSAPGTYWVDVSVNGCDKRDSIVIGYINPLTFSIGSDTVYCGSFSRILTAGIANTVWNTGDTATAITVTAPGIYWARVIACSDTLTDSITISQNPVPLVNLGNDTSLCTGSTLLLDAATANASYLWQNGTTDPTLLVSTQGLYWADVTVNGCDKRDSILVNYLSPPVIMYLGGDTTICEDSSLILNVYEPSASYQWNTGVSTSSISVNQAGTYAVTVSNICGSTTASETVNTKQCTCKVAIPTAFSPNGDGKNEKYGLLTQCPILNYQIHIYNRWGQLIFVSNNLMDKWDGTYKNAAQPIGVYVWYIQYTDPYTSEKKSLSGNVTLLR